MIDHVAAFFRREQEDLRFRAYLTDAIKAVTENTSHYFVPGAGDVITYGAIMPHRWIDGTKKQETDTRTGDEIAADVIRRAGLTLKGGNK